MSENKTGYPFVFVHGMFGWGDNEGINKTIPYWGATTGDLIAKLNDKGYECYAASVGPISGAWDQACELYAQLAGTRVDYGAAHAKKNGHHRFGRTYSKPLFNGWSSEKKVHLVGHSFGGNCARMLAHLLTFGAPEELAETGEDTSPLFRGGNSSLVCSVTAICSPLNSTACYELIKKYHLYMPMRMSAYAYAGLLGRSSLNGKLVDFHLEQRSLTNTPGKHDSDDLRKILKKCEYSVDEIAYDMTYAGSNFMNTRINISPDIYYFSHPFNAVEKTKNGKLRPKNTDFFLLTMISNAMLKDAQKNHAEESLEYCENDGLVNVASAKHPPHEPYKDYKVSEELVPGIWHVMPTSTGDHGTAIGLFANSAKTLSFYLELLHRLQSVEQKTAETAL